MKNILFVIESLQMGGAERSLLSLLNNLDYTCLNVDLMLFKRGGVQEKDLTDKVNIIDGQSINISGCERVRYKLARFFNFKKLHNAQMFWKIVRNKYKVYPTKYDIAIGWGQGFATYFTSEYICADKKYAWLNTDYRLAGYKIAVDYSLYKNFTKIVAVSEGAKKIFLNELSKIEKKLDVGAIVNIIDIENVETRSNEKYEHKFAVDKINIVSVGGLTNQKGWDFATDAAKKLKQQGHSINWYVLGDGIKRTELEEQIKRNNVQDCFFLLGTIPNPYPYIKDCDIYVQTSRFEGLGRTIIEASLLNKPIVTTNFPTAYGIIEHEKTGLICEMNADSIAESVERLINDKKLADSFVDNLKQQDKEKDKKNTLKQIYELFEIE